MNTINFSLNDNLSHSSKGDPLKSDKLPIEYPVREAIAIYLKRLGIFFKVAIVSFSILSLCLIGFKSPILAIMAILTILAPGIRLVVMSKGSLMANLAICIILISLCLIGFKSPTLAPMLILIISIQLGILLILYFLRFRIAKPKFKPKEKKENYIIEDPIK